MSSNHEMDPCPQRHVSGPGGRRLSATAVQRRPPTGTLASRCPGGISGVDWGPLVHVCWPVGSQAHHILLSQLPQARDRRLEIVV